MKFKDLKFKPHPNMVGVQAVVEDKISVVKTPFSYGSENGLYECGCQVNGEWVIEGWCSPEDVEAFIKKYLDKADTIFN